MDLSPAWHGIFRSGSTAPVLAFAFALVAPLMLGSLLSPVVMAEESFPLTLTSQVPADASGETFTTVRAEETWPAASTAVIVCDVWDYHHCLNAVRRLEEFAPRLDAVVAEARRRGATIIHAPSDCMEAYANHPARQRAMDTQAADSLPDQITAWCSAIPSEEKATYPIDQSDGGEDDDPEEHAAWARKLEALGRNPRMPWKQQSPLIAIDEQADFITDRGDEVWNILTARGIDHVILVGVHVNMCVLGRPFGLRQLSRHGKQVVLMRDMTDSMYNPARWPFVSHFEGTRRVIDHIERHVCPTITSDQLIGGTPFQFAGDQPSPSEAPPSADADAAVAPWETVTIAHATDEVDDVPSSTGSQWYRCTLFAPASLLDSDDAHHSHAHLLCGADVEAAWLNGEPLTRSKPGVFAIAPEQAVSDDVNLLVLKTPGVLTTPPVVEGGDTKLELSGRWQRLVGEMHEPWTMPLPAKFGASPEILVSP